MNRWTPLFAALAGVCLGVWLAMEILDGELCCGLFVGHPRAARDLLQQPESRGDAVAAESKDDD